MTDFYRVWTLLAVLYVLLAMAVIPAHAQQCAPHEAMLSGLEKHHGETPVGTGTAKSGKNTTELLIAPSGTWNVVVTNTDGISCIVSAGTSWEFALPEKGDAL